MELNRQRQKKQWTNNLTRLIDVVHNAYVWTLNAHVSRNKRLRHGDRWRRIRKRFNDRSRWIVRVGSLRLNDCAHLIWTIVLVWFVRNDRFDGSDRFDENENSSDDTSALAKIETAGDEAIVSVQSLSFALKQHVAMKKLAVGGGGAVRMWARGEWDEIFTYYSHTSDHWYVSSM
jgi:hypothetical protein